MSAKNVYDIHCDCFKDLPVRGLLHIMILNLLNERSMYGSEIHQALKDRFCMEVPKAIIYSLLRRMEKKGYLTSEWDTEGTGPAKRVYKLSDAGKNYYEQSKRGLEKLSRIINKILVN
ncbi:MAG: helix-turn-helix transcriptional regulator [Euryarchaeota archaeon]|nr:helix-turn-helix transcriptional regulator [Euryarchaeota archaeon]